LPYRIRDWNLHFENNRTRELKRMDWVPMPNRMDGTGYLTLVNHRHGASHFGAWVAIVEIASRCSVRGTLTLSNGAFHTPSTLARVSRMSVEVMSTALRRLVEVGWIEEYNESNAGTRIDSVEVIKKIPQDGAEIPQDGASRARANGTEGNGRERNTPVLPAFRTDEPSPAFDAWWALWSSVRGTNHRANAEQVFPRSVTTSMETDCMHCTASYLQSLSDPNRGFNPENFLIDQARDKFTARWPARASPNGTARKQSLSERTMALWEKRLAEGKSPL
jgi:hypothetical protein